LKPGEVYRDDLSRKSIDVISVHSEASKSSIPSKLDSRRRRLQKRLQKNAAANAAGTRVGNDSTQGSIIHYDTNQYSS